VRSHEHIKNLGEKLEFTSVEDLNQLNKLSLGLLRHHIMMLSDVTE
jgi:hypothetical protein